jgi:hypothetical protein
MLDAATVDAHIVARDPPRVKGRHVVVAACWSDLALADHPRGLHLWDDKPWHELSNLYVELARKTDALSELPLALSTRAIMLLFVGDL